MLKFAGGKFFEGEGFRLLGLLGIFTSEYEDYGAGLLGALTCGAGPRITRIFTNVWMM